MVEIYSPRTNSWCTGPPKPTPASELANSGVTTTLGVHGIGSGFFGLNLSAHEVLVPMARCLTFRARPSLR